MQTLPAPPPTPSPRPGVSTPRASRGARALETAAALGALAAAGAVPSSAWLSWFPNRGEAVAQGVVIFRLALAAVALFFLLARRLDWWGRPAAATRRPAWSALEVTGVAVLVAVAAILRGYRLGEGLWLDEILTLVNYAREPFMAIVTTYDSQNQHFLYSILAHASFLAFGESAWALRLPAALFGVGSVALLYLFAREVAPRREASAAAAFLALSSHHIWFSQNARGYSALAFWTLLSSWALLRALDSRRGRTWLLYAASVALGVFSHMTMLFVAIGQFLVYAAVQVRSPRRDLRPVATGFVLSALLTVLLHALALPQILGPGLDESTNVVAWNSPLWTISETLRGLQAGLGVGLGAGVAIGLVILSAGLISHAKSRSAVVGLFLLPAILGAGTTMALGHPLWPRFFFFAAGFGVLVVVRGTERVGAWVAERIAPRQGRLLLGHALTAGLVAAAALTASRAYGPKQDFVAARDLVERSRGEGDRVVAAGLAIVPYTRYLAPHWDAAPTAADVKADAAAGLTWLVYTMPIHMEADHPDVLAIARRDFELAATFEGSVNGGTVLVWRSRPGRSTRAAAASR